MMKQVAVLALLAVTVSSVYGQDSMADLKDQMVERGGRFPCMGSATYKVIVYFKWNSMTNPDAYPDGGVFSPHVVASHGSYYTMWSPNGWASQGIQDVAETGSPVQLFEELTDQLRRNALNRKKEAGPTASGTEVVTVRIRVDGGRSYISSASMLFPSPDWFTGIEMENMCNTETGTWYNVKRGNLSVWDAGTDSGRDFTSGDSPLRPAQRRPIMSILGSRFGGVPVGEYKIVRV